MSTEWYDPGSYTKLRSIKTVFWSGKQLTDKTVVKDYTQPLKVITLRKDFDENQKLTSMAVEFTRQDKAGYSNDASYSCYTADMSTLITFGNPLKE